LDRVRNPNDVMMILEDRFFYVRSTVADNGTNSSLPQQSIYFIDQDITPKLALANNLTAEQVQSWRNTVFSLSENGKYYFYIVEERLMNATREIRVS